MNRLFGRPFSSAAWENDDVTRGPACRPIELEFQDNAYTMRVNPGYLTYFDLPKIADMKQFYPTLWVEKPVLVFASNG